MTDTTRIEKLFSLALHHGTPEHEAAAAGLMALKLCRKNHVVYLSIGGTPKPEPPKWTPPPQQRAKSYHVKDHIMGFGKYANRRVEDIVRRDRQYANCVVHNVSHKKTVNAFDYWLNEIKENA